MKVVGKQLPSMEGKRKIIKFIKTTIIRVFEG